MDVHTHLDGLSDPDDHDGPLAGVDGLDEPHFAAAAHVSPAHDAHDHLWIAEGDRIWDLGPAETDTDADGVADSLTRVGPDGMTVYTDTDHDGRVDAITEVRGDGEVETHRLDDRTGEWVRTDVGRLR
ncbi:DUF6802 family protein [Williamsia deligens]|uniref:DUF6802 family protein n=1 Tax=Williamsia deligens TaxID=321325 RepID=A0ABW3G8H9_9NOCA|nr:DUF6802 family protein [Williamsia deligens]MCP2194050.1 hypothetical protein [Williamsia deligens]